jgi:methyltransferase (TIGR00027 family)
MPIESVSDTARWVAMYRAMESDRPDALFHDRFARELAGERGQAIVDTLPGADKHGWTIAVRTAVFDEIVTGLVNREGVDIVLNLAAGLDTRPYRLELPEELRWVEGDLGPIIAHKERVLANQRPNCQLERVAIDLSDVDGRRKLFDRVGSSAKRLLVLTEGLVMYLDDAQVASFASDLSEMPNTHFWALDIIGPLMKHGMNLAWRRTLTAGNSTFKFAPPEGAAFFRPFGWQVRGTHSAEAESIHYGRLPFYMMGWKYGRRLSRRLQDVVGRQTGTFLLMEQTGTGRGRA